jgi:RNA polymerase sigma factor (sigma-70 family)
VTSAFEQLYLDRHDRMVRLAYLLIGSQAEAEELVQDAFVRLHGRFDGLDEPAAYLRTSVVNACRNHLRRRTVERTYAARQAPASASLPPEVDSLWDVVQGLRPRPRAALVLRYYEDLPIAEVGRALGCSEGAAASLIRRALADVKEELR